MSISSIVTLGFNGGVYYIPTLGYSSGEAPEPSVNRGGGWPPVLVGNKKGRRKAKRLIDEIRAAVEALEPQAPETAIVKADALITEIREVIPVVDRFPEMLQQLIHLEQQLKTYIQSINDDDDEFFLLM